MTSFVPSSPLHILLISIIRRDDRYTEGKGVLIPLGVLRQASKWWPLEIVNNRTLDTSYESRAPRSYFRIGEVKGNMNNLGFYFGI